MWSRFRRPFSNISSDAVTNFPELSERELTIRFTGSHQLEQAASYFGEKWNEGETLNLKYLIESRTLLRVELQSRYINSKKYKYTSNLDSMAGVIRMRTVGCYSHVAAVVHYLACARFLSCILRPTVPALSPSDVKSLSCRNTFLLLNLCFRVTREKPISTPPCKLG